MSPRHRGPRKLFPFGRGDRRPVHTPSGEPAHAGAIRKDGPFTGADLVSFLVRMHYRRVDSDIDNPDGIEGPEVDDPYCQPERWGAMLFGRQDFDPDEEEALIVPYGLTRIFAKRSDPVFMTFARDWFGTSDVTAEHISELQRALFAPYRPDGLSDEAWP